MELVSHLVRKVQHMVLPGEKGVVLDVVDVPLQVGHVEGELELGPVRGNCAGE